jgi:hypothetical protein
MHIGPHVFLSRKPGKIGRETWKLAALYTNNHETLGIPTQGKEKTACPFTMVLVFTKTYSNDESQL